MLKSYAVYDEHQLQEQAAVRFAKKQAQLFGKGRGAFVGLQRGHYAMIKDGCGTPCLTQPD